METTRLLAHYRVPVLHDADLTSLLAHLFRTGPQSEEDLAQKLGRDCKHVSRQLVRLYRSALVRRLASGKWVVSDAAERVLEGIDIHELAASELIGTLARREAERTFFDACLSSAQRQGQADVLHAHLRAVRFVHFAHHGEAVALNDSATRAATYALVFGTDYEVRLMDTSDWSSIVSLAGVRLCLLNACDSSDVSGLLQQEQEAVLENCRIGLSVYGRSNLALLRPHLLAAHTADEAVTRTTLARVLSGTFWSRPDPDLVLCSRGWEDQDYIALWRGTLSHLDVREQVAAMCETWTGRLTTTFDDLISDLSHLLREKLQKREVSQHAADLPLGVFEAQKQRKALREALGLLRTTLAIVRELDIGEADREVAEVREVIGEIRGVLDAKQYFQES